MLYSNSHFQFPIFNNQFWMFPKIISEQKFIPHIKIIVVWKNMQIMRPNTFCVFCKQISTYHISWTITIIF